MARRCRRLVRRRLVRNPFRFRDMVNNREEGTLMRIAILLSLFVPLVGLAQAQTSIPKDRLRIEVIPVPAFGVRTVRGEEITVPADYGVLLDEFADGLVDALAVLGVRQDEYELFVWRGDGDLLDELALSCNVFERWKSAVGLVIAGRTLPDSIGCNGSSTGPFLTEGRSFSTATQAMFETYKTYTALQLGTVYLFAILAPDELRWPGTAGNAIAYKAVDPKSPYPYMNQYCVAFATNRPIVIAHELGACAVGTRMG